MRGININQTIDKMVKDKFLAIFKDAQKRAEEKYNKSIAPVLKDKSTFDKIKFLKSEKDKIAKLNEDVQLSAYVGSATNEDWLLKMFASRTTILNVDDSEDINKAVYAGRLSALIVDELLEIRTSIPNYTYEDFLAGKKDPIFTELDYFWHIGDKQDGDKIRLWQANKIVLMISCETCMIINTAQTALSNNPDAIAILSRDLDQYESSIKEKEFDTPAALIKELKKLSFLSEYNFNLLDNTNALNDFHTFQDKDLSWKRITPEYIEKSRKLLDEAGKIKPFSESPIIFYTIAQIMQWIEKVVNGQQLMMPFIYPDYHQIVDDILKKAEAEADKTIEEFEDSIDLPNLSDKEAEQQYISALEGIRHEFNDLEEHEKQYFATIHRENAHQIFQINAIFFDLVEHENALVRAANLYFRLINFLAACRSISGSIRINYPNSDDDFNPHEVNYLAATMVLDNDLHDKLSNIYSTAMSDMMQYALPMDFVSQNIKEQMHEIFIECIERLLEYLEDCESGNKVLFIQSRLKDLRQRELKNKALTKRYNEKFESGYTTMFKEYLELEADFISSTKDVHFIPALNAPRIQNALPEKTVLSFGYKQKDSTKLLSFITTLNHKIVLLNEQHTSAADLLQVLTAKEINDDLPHIYFNCETTQLSYIFNKLKPYFTKLTFQNIEKSQLFYTKNGNPLKGQNLSASKIDYPKDQDEIDKAFSLLQ
jgi:hypothetical protein